MYEQINTPTQVTPRGADIKTKTVTIAASGTKTDAIDLKTDRLSGVQIPSAWTAANLTLEVSADNSTFVPLYDQTGTIVTMTVGGTSRVVKAPLVDLLAYRFVKLVSTNAQDAARELILHLVP